MTSLYASMPNLRIDLSRWSCNTSTGSLFLTRTGMIESAEGLDGETGGLHVSPLSWNDCFATPFITLLKPSSTLSVTVLSTTILKFRSRSTGIIKSTWLMFGVREPGIWWAFLEDAILGELVLGLSRAHHAGFLAQEQGDRTGEKSFRDFLGEGD